MKTKFFSCFYDGTEHLVMVTIEGALKEWRADGNWHVCERYANAQEVQESAGVKRITMTSVRSLRRQILGIPKYTRD